MNPAELQLAIRAASKLPRSCHRGSENLPSNIYSHGNRYRVQFRRAGVDHIVGSFSTIDEAKAAAAEWLRANPRNP